MYAYVIDKTADARGEVHRVSTEAVRNFMAVQRDGASFAYESADETIEAMRERAGKAGVTLRYEMSDFKTWWTDGISAESRLAWVTPASSEGAEIEPAPEGTFYDNGDPAGVLLSLEDGEPVDVSEEESDEETGEEEGEVDGDHSDEDDSGEEESSEEEAEGGSSEEVGEKTAE